jgi:hypothetical protein
MAGPGSLTLTELIALTKQALGGRATGLLNDAWYTSRINSAYARLTTFQGMVQAPGMRKPQHRAVRFFELYEDDDRDITAAIVTTSNFITPTATSAQVVYVDNVYDLDNDRPLARKSVRHLNRRNPQETGTPQIWCPGGKGATGYYIYPIPSTSSEEIAVRERTYQYPAVLTGADVPVIPAAWHTAIWYAAVAEGAALLDWVEKAEEYEGKFIQFIAERRSPVEESGGAGGRRHFSIGG